MTAEKMVRAMMKLLSLILLSAGVVAAQSSPPQKDIPTIAKESNGVIVSIITSDKDGHPVAQGSGFVVSKDGRILTNYHVIQSGTSAIVKFPDGAFYDVEGMLAFDKDRDLAVIKARGQNFRTVILGNSDRLQVGETVVAIGNPLSLESTVSSGILSGIRDIEDEGGKYLQITAPISPGSSGGPLFNMAGEVVGITTLYLKGGENLNFAIPVNDAKLLLATGSKVQDFPVETEAAKSEAHAEAAPSPSVNPTAARAYYKQLYDAGGFFNLERFVCFHDDPSLQWFFTFTVYEYDIRYSKAAKAHMEALLDKTKDDTQAWNTMRSIEASRPNVNFLDDDLLSTSDYAFGAGTETYLRGGGQLLAYSSYYKGVTTGPEHFRGTEKLWTFDFDSSPSHNHPDELLLTFEPITLRYVLMAGGKVGLSGTCEEIPAKQSASHTKERSEAYVITAHTVVHDEDTNSRLDNYVIVHGSEVLKVQYAESQISTEKQGTSSLEWPLIQGKDLHLHFRYRVWPQEPDVSQVPQVGVPIRACEMDTNYPGSVENPAIAIQSVAAPCMSRDGDTLHYSIAPNGGIKMMEYVDFDILSETVATTKKR